MGREWAELSAAVSAVDACWKDSPRLTYRTAAIVRVHLWSVHHDRPTSWACDEQNWDARRRPAALPDQSTMSRRTRGKHGKRFEAFLDAVSAKLGEPPPQQQQSPQIGLVKILDGKPLTVAAHSQDRDAAWGRGAGQQSNGYKLHLVIGAAAFAGPMPLQWALTPLDVDERSIAPRLIRRLGGGGYLLADANYEAWHLYRHAAAANHQMLSPRKSVHVKNAAGLSRRRRCHGEQRVRSIEALEPPADINRFGPEVHRLRRGIESSFGNLTGFGGGLQGLPSWVRRIWRVRNWVYGKLLINACRIRCRQRGRA